jgi:hypothetical protein
VSKRSNNSILAANLFSKLLYKANFSSKKGNKSLLSIDLLKANKRKQLVSIVIFKLESFYTELLKQKPSTAFNTVQKKGNLILLYIIKNVCEDFLAKQYGYNVKVDLNELKQALYTENILRDVEILFQVPLFTLADPQSPKFRLLYYPIYNTATPSFIEALFDNLVIEISNCVVYFIILKFSSVYAFRQTLYRSQFLSLRNFERFKNNLNWQTRIKKYFKRPVNLYNNRYDLYILRSNGIYSRTIYANRPDEIKDLGKFQLLTIASIEIRDFISSRLDETIYTLIKSIRFTLTSVIGQVIGLIWRGIIESLKN